MLLLGGATKRSRSQAPTQQKEELNDFLNQCFAKRIEALPEDDEIQLEVRLLQRSNGSLTTITRMVLRPAKAYTIA
jgi:hypothetical protein